MTKKVFRRVDLFILSVFLIVFGLAILSTARHENVSASQLSQTSRVSLGTVGSDLSGSHILYGSRSSASIFGVPAGSLEKIGTPKPIADWSVQNDTKHLPESGSGISGFTLSSDKTLLAVQEYSGIDSHFYLLDLKTRDAVKSYKVVDRGIGDFMAWHPSQHKAIYRAEDVDVNDPGLWIIDVDSGEHTRLDVPEIRDPWGLTAAVFSADGARIYYSYSKGMGFGSSIYELVAADSGGDVLTSSKLQSKTVWESKTLVVANLKLSPSGKTLLFSAIPDTPTPFLPAGIFTIDTSSYAAKLLDFMDGGRGQAPIWSVDGNSIVYVARENVNYINADQNDILISSIKRFDIAAEKPVVLVPAEGARQTDVSITPTGEILYISNRTGKSEVWHTTIDGKYTQVTKDGEDKTIPIFLPE